MTRRCRCSTGGGREISNFKGEDYRLSWEGRAGIAMVAIANGYPIVPVGHVGGDGICVTTRDSALGALTLATGAKLTGLADVFFQLMRGVRPH
ncbi:hypothetical protein SBI67_14130 [Mycolicibacterium sp. 120266]|uniref:hypothetical protein n=1 Tax=Mycolicibacterium sp. 120266 TaxID=3090601 RepID=UPI00299D6382|nr:hypothetical protein [Mycolicibacterium sp. 120266]MDX1873260.1 hypothetical protein [Mycolicibacterium sp. 120266]